MRDVLRIALFIALVAFGTVMAAVTPMYASIPSCNGRSDLLCDVRERESCTRRTICGIGSNGISTCCSQKETITDYFYWEADY